jgi:hypothetical protein
MQQDDLFDPWTELANRQISPRRKRDLASKAAKVDRRMEKIHEKKEQDDQRRMMNMYRRNFVERKRTLLAGEYRPQLAVLIKFIRRLMPEHAVPLIEMIRQAHWLKAADMSTRLMVLSLIDSSIIRHRIRHGLPPLDDPVMGQPDNVFLIVRKLLTGV